MDGEILHYRISLCQAAFVVDSAGAGLTYLHYCHGYWGDLILFYVVSLRCVAATMIVEAAVDTAEATKVAAVDMDTAGAGSICVMGFEAASVNEVYAIWWLCWLRWLRQLLQWLSRLLVTADSVEVGSCSRCGCCWCWVEPLPSWWVLMLLYWMNKLCHGYGMVAVVASGAAAMIMEAASDRSFIYSASHEINWFLI